MGSSRRRGVHTLLPPRSCSRPFIVLRYVVVDVFCLSCTLFVENTVLLNNERFGEEGELQVI